MRGSTRGPRCPVRNRKQGRRETAPQEIVGDIVEEEIYRSGAPALEGNSMKFAAVGFTCIDVYKNLNISYPTGNGVDLMFNLMDLYPELVPSVVTAVGDDEEGACLIEACRRRGVDTGHVAVVPGGRTAVIEMLLNGRDRVHHRADKGVMIPYQPSGEDMDFIRSQDYIHTDLSWQVTGLLKDMRKKGTQVYFDFSGRYRHPDVPEILKNIDYGIFSFEEESDEVRDLLKYGCGVGAKVLLATFGEKGSLAFDGHRFYRQPCFPAERVVNTVGAGDSFGAGFMNGILRGEDIPSCMAGGAKKAAEIVGIFEPYHISKSD